jgi:hypothetical protein
MWPEHTHCSVDEFEGSSHCRNYDGDMKIKAHLITGKKWN